MEIKFVELDSKIYKEIVMNTKNTLKKNNRPYLSIAIEIDKDWLHLIPLRTMKKFIKYIPYCFITQYKNNETYILDMHRSIIIKKKYVSQFSKDKIDGKDLSYIRKNYYKILTKSKEYLELKEPFNEFCVDWKLLKIKLIEYENS
jgi:hypothetical protein